MSAWLLLITAICTEVAGTLGLRASAGLNKLAPPAGRLRRLRHHPLR